MTEQDKEDVLIDAIADLTDASCQLVALSKEKQTNITEVVYVDENGNDKAILVYDFRPYYWKSTDTMDKLAQERLGNANLGTVISYYNKIDQESEVKAGTLIKIPVLEEDSKINTNAIYAAPEKQESYGVDISLTDDGGFLTSQGDLGVISGRDNLTQALAIRLTTASSKRIRLVSYGIRSTVGETMAVESYLTGSIEQTILADPRIKEVEEISFRGEGDNLKLEVTYIDINGNQGEYRGEL